MRRDLEREVLGRRIERAYVGVRGWGLGVGDKRHLPAPDVHLFREARPVSGIQHPQPPTPNPPPIVQRIWQARIGQADPLEQLALRLDERCISAVRRRGKYLLLELDSGET